MFGRTQGVLAATLGMLAMGACDTPTELSDLRPEGPPEVLTVLVADTPGDDPLFNSIANNTETATFCKQDDAKRPNFVNYPLAVGGVQICPDDISMGVPEVTDATPVLADLTGWYVRVQFDELLTDDIEDLIPILDDDGIDTGTSTGSLKNTQPVTLTCGGAAVPYDGYYAPEGNDLTWPLGPSLFIGPLDTTVIPTGTECEITMKSVIVDKDGNSVPTNEVGPYKFAVAPLTVILTSQSFPDDPTMPDPQDPTAPLVVNFNAFVNDASVPAGDILIQTVTDCSGAGATTVATFVQSEGAAGDPTALDIADNDELTASAGATLWKTGVIYLVSFSNTTAVHDANGGTGSLPEAADFQICFGT